MSWRLRGWGGLDSHCLSDRHGIAGQLLSLAGGHWNERLSVSDLTGGTYIDAVSDDAHLTRTKAVRERRWRVNNNLPGTRAFCPIIRRSQALTQSLQFNPLDALAGLDHPFGEDEDGVKSNFVFDAYDDANAAWRYPDLTEHAIYTAQLVAHTIRHEMADEARVLLRFELAQQRIKDVLEMPDSDAVRMIRSIKENGWQISGKLVNECRWALVARYGTAWH